MLSKKQPHAESLQNIVTFFSNRQILSDNPPDSVLHFDGEIVSPITHVKDLGLYMDRYMPFDVHANEISKKVMETHVYK